MPSVLVTGSNRGLGLEWARLFATEGWRVYATCRHPAEANDLATLANQYPNLTIHRLDVTSTEDTRALYWAFKDQPLDVLLNNAGIYLEKGDSDIGCLRYDEWERSFQVNTIGAARVTETFLDNLELGERGLVVVTSSHMGSISDIESPGDYYYRSSKAALNAAFKGLSHALNQRGISVFILHPGAVKTRMGGPESTLTAEQSVKAMRVLLDRLGPSDSGRFFRYNGVELPW